MHDYKGPKFTRDQLIFMVETALVSALDRIESGTPTGGCDWETRLKCANGDDSVAKGLLSYDAGAIETAGMNLACIYAQLTGDGMGVGDAVVCCGFSEAVENWIELIWFDKGASVRARMKQLGKGGWTVSQAYTNYPDCKAHAVRFVDECLDEYLSPFSDEGYEREHGSVVKFPDTDADCTIRIVDEHGNTVDVIRMGDPDWQELRNLFPDDALYFQPEDAGEDGSTINSFHVYRDHENAVQAHPDGDIQAYSFADIEKPVFLDVDNPTYHDKSNDPNCEED